ncbi:hypothetical protein LM13656_10056 [Listeria monocytogenes]|nr:hypothetical protein LM13656_10056 [Listeria monocytogenes]CUK38077.1 hypothetical protein LM500008_260321 [Listeria monocytogenes]CUK41661.1 hypothetical protein LM500172_230318 [Listeria monocytogenes]CUK46246.1 hypothetical protein LM500190_270302 [Listeria monocytogenes]CUK48108.1 hypothetical protein LM500704_10058 [Listeria monocytogenes]
MNFVLLLSQPITFPEVELVERTLRLAVVTICLLITVSFAAA